MMEANETTEVVQLARTDDTALEAKLDAEFAAEQWQQDQFANYEKALASGVIDNLFVYTHQHGKPEPYSDGPGLPTMEVVRWVVVKPGLNLACVAFPTGGLAVVRNDECVLDDREGRNLCFDPGQGLWLKTLMLEHAQLEREAAQKKRLAERQAQLEQAQHRNRAI